MKYNEFRPVRRKDRVMDDVAAVDLLLKGEYGFLALGSQPGGYAYGIPVNYVYDHQNQEILIHCAPEGHKLECITHNPHVSLCVVGRTEPLPDKFTTIYHSVIVFGSAQLVEGGDELRDILKKIVSKYSPGLEQKGDTYIERSLSRTRGIRIRVEHMTAKCKPGGH